MPHPSPCDSPRGSLVSALTSISAAVARGRALLRSRRTDAGRCDPDPGDSARHAGPHPTRLPAPAGLRPALPEAWLAPLWSPCAGLGARRRGRPGESLPRAPPRARPRRPRAPRLSPLRSDPGPWRRGRPAARKGRLREAGRGGGGAGGGAVAREAGARRQVRRVVRGPAPSFRGLRATQWRRFEALARTQLWGVCCLPHAPSRSRSRSRSRPRGSLPYRPLVVSSPYGAPPSTHLPARPEMITQDCRRPANLSARTSPLPGPSVHPITWTTLIALLPPPSAFYLGTPGAGSAGRTTGRPGHAGGGRRQIKTPVYIQGCPCLILQLKV